MRHYETHLYTYAVALMAGGIKPDNLAGMRAKAIAHGHTEGEALCVERNPLWYIRTGKFN